MPDLGRVAALATLALLTGCSVVEPEPWDDRQIDLERARARWAEADPGSYRYDFFQGCFCAAPVGHFVVTVTDGVVTAAVTEHDGEPVSDATLDGLPTVEGLFDVVDGAIRAEVDGYRVGYHPDHGFPTVIDLDRDERAIDDELRIEAGGLVPLP